ncbi:helix-turn-helix transcriptional regulator [Oscillibacter sp. MSJ-2]|uniref:Helix-turn-helix transcriptional regulator n=1 Tax=Dysosmobacter acutus TaxID=2841504 RepID=A0ABS6FCF2_9FIRM|nr:helix-turn-helix transcriptional regulator [Dysosmobacter acutus]MBU5627748.1 helix-turn-helix transcriptional regulator [Dysosmobacter acutus]
MVNANLLKGKIAAAGYSQQSLAPKVKMSVNSLNAKINGRKKFDTDEVSRICSALGITDPNEKCNIFLF